MKEIAVCGSMDFFNEMDSMRAELEALGLKASIPAPEEIKIDYSAASDGELARVKKQFIDEHLAKIRRADAILIANIEKRGIHGYIGANTLMEAAFAYALGKGIFVLHPIGEQPCRPEMLGLEPELLSGDLKKLKRKLMQGEHPKADGPLGVTAG
jgi:nucleoside 2-deoxyribosyltransferase